MKQAPRSRPTGASAPVRDLARLRRPWQEFSDKKGLRASKIRESVVDAFLTTDEHIDLESLLARVRKRTPSVGMATVYRTMKLLEEASVAHARDFDGRTIYEVAVGRAHHDHLVCEKCGRIVEFLSDEIEKYQEEIAIRHGFVLRRHRHELFGLCPDCKKKALAQR